MSKIKEIKKFHFIGAGGVSISALMKLMLQQNKTVSGSDRQFSDTLTELQELGADVWVGSAPERIPTDALVVYSSAVGEADAELRWCRDAGITAIERYVFLSEAEKLFGREIAIAGTHGKTTVTSMLASIFLCSDACFTAHIGGKPVGFDNLVYRGTDWFLTEACEYRRSLHAFHPEFAVVLNAECDHPDTYRDLSDVYAAFDAFLQKPSVKHSFLEFGSAYQQRYIPTGEHMHTFSLAGGNYCADNLEEDKNGCFGFQIVGYGIPICDVKLKVPGKHNALNAVAAAAVATEAGISSDAVKRGLEEFLGVERRFQLKGETGGAKVIIDYAHHPSEIRAAIDVAKKVAQKRVIVVFQPHTYSRTALLFDDFKTAFLQADALYITKCYSAREQKGAGKTAYELCAAIKKDVMYCAYHENLISLANAVCRDASEGDVVLILGAGDVFLLADLIVDLPPTV